MLKEFKNPSTKYRPLPFWSWNETLEPHILKEQILEMKEEGMGGYFMHARSGLTTEYLSEDWYRCIETGIKTAREENLQAWIYDEEGWPSGFAGGLVTAMSKDFHAKFMTLMEYEKASDIEWDKMLAVYEVEKDGTFRRVSQSEIAEGKQIKKETTLKTEVVNSIHYIGIKKHIQQYYIDVMNKAAVDAFLSVTHQAYYDRFGEYFGNELQGFFTDEPRFTCNRFGELAWSDTLPQKFRYEMGYEILDYLPMLWREYEGYEKVRYDFWRCANDAFVISFMKNIYDWCEEHHCLVTGHIMLEESIFGQMTSTGGVMPFYEYEHIPGIDWLRRRIESPVIAKQVGSVACQLGKKQVITESYALTGWNVSFEELKWILDWQFVNGVNMLCQHLMAYSLKGSRKRDYPPSHFIQQSWWKKYHKFTDYVSRLSVVLSSGNEVADVLLLHPMRSGFLAFDGTRTGKIRKLDNEFTEISNILTQNHISYHYGDETIISKYGSIKKASFIVGEVAYKTVILPTMYCIDNVTLDLLLEFHAQGGVIYSAGEFPSYTNGDMDKLAMLKEKAVTILGEELLFYMREKNLVSVSVEAKNQQIKNISYQQRETKDGTLLFLVNHSQIDTYEADILLYGRKGKPELLVLETGESKELAYEAKENTKLSLRFEPMQSYVLLIKDCEESKKDIGKVNTKTLKLGTEWNVERMGLNSLTLDLCRYRIDGGDLMGPIPAIKLMKQLLELQHSCDIELYYEFDVNMDLTKNQTFFLALEDASHYTIQINNEILHYQEENTWKDQAFQTVNLKPYIKQGTNQLVLKGEFYQKPKVYEMLFGKNVYETEKNKLTYDMELESVYLVGDFGVISKSSFEYTERNAMFTDGGFQIVDAPRKFSGNEFTTQGLLFFAEDIVVSQKMKLSNTPGERIILEFGKHQAPLVELYVNHQLVKTSLWAPYEVDITDVALEGENKITLHLFASNRNLFGPHHHINGECFNVGPDSFTGKWSWVERDSESDATDIADRTKNYWNDAYCFVEFGVGK